MPFNFAGFHFGISFKILIASCFIFLSIFFAPLLLVAQEKKLTPRQIKKAEAKAKVDKLIQEEEEGALIFQKQSAFGHPGHGSDILNLGGGKPLLHKQLQCRLEQFARAGLFSPLSFVG